MLEDLTDENSSSTSSDGELVKSLELFLALLEDKLRGKMHLGSMKDEEADVVLGMRGGGGAGGTPSKVLTSRELLKLDKKGESNEALPPNAATAKAVYCKKNQKKFVCLFVVVVVVVVVVVEWPARGG
jgi:hypothetical protein